MKRVYRADSLLEAQLVADTLISMGIPNHILNAYAVGAMGDLPYSQTSPEVWVDDAAQAVRAADVIATLNEPLLADKLCPHCGETNPGNFLSCWQCHSALAA